MIDCRLVKTRLGRFVDGELPPQESAAIEAHIQGCPGCQLELRALQALSASLDALAVPPVPAGTVAVIMANVRRQAAAPHRSWGIPPFWRPWPVPMRFAVAGTVALACWIGLALGSAAPADSSQTPSEMAWVDLSAGAPITSAYLEATR